MNVDDYEIEELLQEQKQKEKAKRIYDTTPAHKEYVHKVNVGLSKRELAGSIMSRDKNRNKYKLVSEKNMQYKQLLESGEIDGNRSLLVQVIAFPSKPLPQLGDFVYIQTGPLANNRFEIIRYIGQLRKNRVAIVRRI